MYPVIVLEGPDCAGKSTLAEFLRLKWGAKVNHLTYRWKDRMPMYHWAALEWALRERHNQPVIIDRWWPSEAIYADAFRGGTKWPMMGRMLDRVAIKSGFIYVSCLPTSEPEKHLAMFNERAEAGGELFNTMGEVANMYGQWDYRMWRRDDTAHYDMFVEGQDMAGFAQRLEDMHITLMSETPSWWMKDEKAGPTRQWAGQGRQPAVLIVGEQSNPKGRHRVWPFFEHANSSLWLTQTLADIGLKEEKIAWVNALSDVGWVNTLLLNKLVEDIRPKRIVTLGRKALSTMRFLGHRVDDLPHPAYVNRFGGSHSIEYKALFTEIRKDANADR